MSNKHLTAANEKQVLELIQNFTIKAEWQCLADYKGRLQADKEIMNKFNLPLTVLRAARYYW